MKKLVPPRAFSLVEVTLAIGIAAFCLLGIFSLLPVGANSNRDSVSTTHAASLTEALVADLRGTKTNDTSLVYGLKPDTAVTDSVIYLKEDGSKVVAASDADYRAAVTIAPPASGVIAPTGIRVLLSWPAAATNQANVLETVTALDRN